MGALRLPGPHKGLAIGIFGGSFNPAHGGHHHVAATALRRLQLDAVWWIVAAGNPLKQEHGDFRQRLSSAGAIARGPNMRVSDLERQAELRYTVDLIRTLKARAPGTRFVWLMGADSLDGFHRWRAWQTIAQNVPIAVIARPGAGPKALRSPFARRFARARIPEYSAARLPFASPPAWTFLKAPLHPASSTAIRANCQRTNRTPPRRREDL